VSIAGYSVRDHDEELAREPAVTEGTSMKQYLLSVHMVEGTPMRSDEEVVIQAADLDAALAIAARGSQACDGPVEVRPFQDMPEQ
jgi:hypothetical protein